MITHQGDIEAWNFKKIFTDQKVMDFTNWRFPSLSSCEYQPLKWISAQSWSGLLQNQPWASIPDVVAFQKARNQQNWSKKNQDAINFQKPAKPTSIRERLQPIRLGSIQSYLWKPGDHLNHSEDIQDVLSWTSIQRIRRILIYFNLPYLESLAITFQQLLPKHVVHDFITYQAIKKIPSKLSYPLKPSRFKRNQVPHLWPSKSHSNDHIFLLKTKLYFQVIFFPCIVFDRLVLSRVP